MIRPGRPGIPVVRACLCSLALSATLLVPAVVAVASRVSVAETECAAILERVKILTAPDLAGRGNGTAAAATAADTIARWFAACGLEPGWQGGWYQDFELKGENFVGRTGRNVVGILSGTGTLAGRYVVVGAHYDHLGRTRDAVAPEQGPPGPDQYYPGADDNASGVALLVTLARRADHARGNESGSLPPVTARSCLFVAFAGEEVGLQGSAFLAKNLPVPRDSVDAMLNLDSVGRLREDKLYVAGVGSAVDFPSLVAAANRDSLALVVSRGGWDASDHVSFNSIEVPVLFLFTGPHPDYHQPSDTWDRLSVDGLGKVAAFAGRLLDTLSEQSGCFPYQMVAEVTSMTPAEGGAGGRRSWLGTIPDFTEEVTGVKLAGVMEGSPAAVAGLAKDDILISLGGEAVADLAGLAHALRSYGPGERVLVAVLREGRRLEFEVTLAERIQR